MLKAQFPLKWVFKSEEVEKCPQGVYVMLCKNVLQPAEADPLKT